MQSEYNELSQKTSLDQSTQESNLAAQHGLEHSDLLPPRLHETGKERSRSRRSASTTSRTTSSSGSSTYSVEESLRRLTQSSPVDRVAKHEKALTRLPKKKKNAGPEFTLIQRGRTTTTGQVVLSDFPNGSLLLFQSA